MSVIVTRIDTPIFESTNVDLRSRDSMEKYLANHPTYWERGCERLYAHNVKVHSIDIPAHLRDKAYDVAFEEWPFEWEWMVEDIRNQLKEETGYVFHFSGRSGAWVVFEGARITDTCWNESGDIYFDDLKEKVKELQAFDHAIEELRENFIWFLENYEMVEETYTVVKTRKVFKPISGSEVLQEK